MAQCLGLPADFGKLWRASGCDELASTHVPIIIHEDGVPHFSGMWLQYFSTFHMESVLEQPNQTEELHVSTPQMHRYSPPKFVPEVVQPQFGAGALVVCGVTLGKSSMPSQSWAHRMSLKILGLRFAGF